MDATDESKQAQSVDIEHQESTAPDRSSADRDGARLIALNMALNGESREDIERYLTEHFQLPDRLQLIDEAYSAIAESSTIDSHESSELPIANPDFSIAGLNPAFTQASPPPPELPDADAQRDTRIKELERLLEKAREQIERGSAVLERSRRRH